MNADFSKTDQPLENNPEELSRLLEIELIQKRAEWQRTTARHKNLKTLSVLFLAIVFLAGVAVFFFVFMQANEGRQQRPTNSGETSRP